MIKRDANYIGYIDSECNTITQPNDAEVTPSKFFIPYHAYTFKSQKHPWHITLCTNFEQK